MFEPGCRVITPQGAGVVKTVTADGQFKCRLTASGSTAKFGLAELTRDQKPQGREALPTVDDLRPDKDIEMDPRVLRGVFGNGMAYYVQANCEPPKRCELTVVLKVGSIHEEENERGIAHMLEHLTFRASKGGGGNDNGSHAAAAGGGGEEFSLVHHLEANGIQFGAHQNAYTSFDETVYFLHVPLDQDDDDEDGEEGGEEGGDGESKECSEPKSGERPTKQHKGSSGGSGGSGGARLLGDCMGVLSSLVLDARVKDEDVEAERSIVVEEWRQRQVVGVRMQSFLVIHVCCVCPPSHLLDTLP